MKLELRTALELKANAFIGATFEELILPEGLETIGGLAFIAGPYAYGNYGRYKEGCQSLSKKISNITKINESFSLK